MKYFDKLPKFGFMWGCVLIKENTVACIKCTLSYTERCVVVMVTGVLVELNTVFRPNFEVLLFLTCDLGSVLFSEE